MTDASHAVLVEILAELRTLNARLTPGKAEDKADAILLREILRSSQGLAFTASDLLLNAELVAGVCQDSPLRDAILLAIGELNTRKLGRWLAGREGVKLDGLTVSRGKAVHDGILWRVLRVSNSL